MDWMGLPPHPGETGHLEGLERINVEVMLEGNRDQGKG